jgi:hypothetical protein
MEAFISQPLQTACELAHTNWQTVVAPAALRLGKWQEPGFDRSRAFFSWKQPDNDRKQCRDPGRYCRPRVPSALLVDHQ